MSIFPRIYDTSQTLGMIIPRQSTIPCARRATIRAFCQNGGMLTSTEQDGGLTAGREWGPS